jgi:2-polyprenyl-3-methyl-5-hydroxy-6-metoxy-1,4-benzoquinol methylase
MNDFKLQQLMIDLYKTEEYFASIPLRKTNGFEEDYHEVAIDPDGKKRYLLQERDHSLQGIKEITDYLDETNPGKILDIGCGLGWLLSSLDENWQKYGIEISEFASRHAKKFGSIHHGTLDDYSTNVKFDVIVMNHVIEHIEKPVEALNVIKDMLSDNGVFIIGTPDFDSPAARRYGNSFRLLNDPTHISLFSSDSMHRCLRDQGYKILKVEYPYFETPFFNKENLLKMLDNEVISPPFYGSIMTFFVNKKSLET